MSDTEAFQGSSRRASSSSSSSESDPIKAARVRTALLQLLQTLIQMDPRALHPYWTALLPSQAPLQASPLSPHLVTMLLFDPVDKVCCCMPSQHLPAIALPPNSCPQQWRVGSAG